MRFEVPDGLLLGDGSPRLWRVFRPRWWQVWRWVAWLRAGERGVVRIGGGDYRVVRAPERPVERAEAVSR